MLNQFLTWVSTFNCQFAELSILGELGKRIMEVVWTNTQNKDGYPASVNKV